MFSAFFFAADTFFQFSVDQSPFIRLRFKAVLKLPERVKVYFRQPQGQPDGWSPRMFKDGQPEIGALFPALMAGYLGDGIGRCLAPFKN